MNVPEHIDPDALWLALWEACQPNWSEYSHWLGVLVWYRWGEA